MGSIKEAQLAEFYVKPYPDLQAKVNINFQPSGQNLIWFFSTCLSLTLTALLSGMAPQGGCGGVRTPPEIIPKINFRAILH